MRFYSFGILGFAPTELIDENSNGALCSSYSSLDHCDFTSAPNPAGIDPLVLNQVYHLSRSIIVDFSIFLVQLRQGARGLNST